jgi:hypothetical protein
LKSHGRNPTDDPADLAANNRQTIMDVQQIFELNKSAKTAEAAAERSANEQELFLLTPWMNAIALALRVSKVTAEWRGYAVGAQVEHR